jgi:membrane protein implicated in regulation of membrane protease activity
VNASLHLGDGAVWMLGGLLVAVLEMLAPGFFLLWVGLAALGTGVVATVSGLGPEPQFAVFVVLTATMVGGVGLRMRRRVVVDTVNAPAAGLIGATCRALAFRDGEGRVALGDGTWQARVTDGEEPMAGTALRVVGLDGTTLLVAAKV